MKLLESILDAAFLKSLKGHRTKLAAATYILLTVCESQGWLLPSQTEGIKQVLIPWGVYTAVDHNK